jgi:hypothetical protein
MYLFALIAVVSLPTALSQSNVEATCSESDVDFVRNSVASCPLGMLLTLAWYRPSILQGIVLVKWLVLWPAYALQVCVDLYTMLN